MVQCKKQISFHAGSLCITILCLFVFSLCIEFDIWNKFDTGNEGKAEDLANERQI